MNGIEGFNANVIVVLLSRVIGWAAAAGVGWLLITVSTMDRDQIRLEERQKAMVAIQAEIAHRIDVLEAWRNSIGGRGH